MPLTSDLPACLCPITQDVMEDPVVCADGHSYERAAITQWLLARDTSPCTNAPLLHKNVVPNHALRNLIAEVRGVRRPITLEEHVAAATPCCPEELDDSQDSTATSTAPTSETEPEPAPVVALGGAPRRDDETAAAPAHAAEAKQPIEPCAALCVQSAIGAKTVRARPVGKNALHWAMVEGVQAEQKQLRLMLNPALAAQPDQGGNLPLHYAASSGVSTASAVACALAFMDGLEWTNKTGRTPLDISRLEGHTGLADVLSGLLNRRHNELHVAFSGAGAGDETEQMRLLACRPELAAQKDHQGNLPLHVGAAKGASLTSIDECIRVYPDAPRCRNVDGLLPHQLALEHGHRGLAELLASRVGKVIPSRPIKSVLAVTPREASSNALVQNAPIADGPSSEPEAK
uniref:U-box domain-containing protein n=1 Tax=Haptolina brevifila TaxID=156173 RepID=A0A7S2GFA9_9EUKA|mmetsp:Transcript_34409/g.68515  ORF Transcript_34409/g.68515 Transcript_34409/m.68515 type:complete len:403 (+) Transcript_34409:53-1261(+)